MPRLIISHAGPDTNAALALAEWLTEHGYADPFLDVSPERGIAAGEHGKQGPSALTHASMDLIGQPPEAALIDPCVATTRTTP
jgi:hypothetical protein